MGLKKGMTNNPNGRKKGTLNKRTVDFRSKIEKLMTDNWSMLQLDLIQLKPVDRVNVMIKLLPYLLPQQSATTVKTEFDKLTDEQLDQIISGLVGGNKMKAA